MALPPGSAFKTKCPSCESGVTIKDPSLIGKKVECPKCKFRFVVEAPSEAAAPPAAGAESKTPKKPGAKPAADAAAKTSRNKPLPKKESAAGKKKNKATGSNKTLLIGGGLAALAVAVLAVGYFAGLFDGESTEGTPAPGGGPVAVAKKGGPVDEPGKKEDDKKGPDTTAKKEPPKVTTQDIVAAEITNMLPENSEWVMRGTGEEILKTPIGGVLFDDGADSAKAFRHWMGFNGANVDRLAFGGSLKTGSLFGVLKLKKDVALEDMTGAMDTDPTPVRIHNRAIYLVKSNELFKMLGEYLRIKAQAAGFPLPPAKNTQFAFALPDPRTVIVADRDSLEDYFRANMKRKFQTTYLRSEPVAPKKAKEPKKAEGQAAPDEPKKEQGAEEKKEEKKELRPAFTSDPSFLSVDPALKSAMYQLDDGKPVVLSVAMRLQDADLLLRQAGGAGPIGVTVPKTPLVGLAVRRMDDKKFEAIGAVEFNRSDDAILTSQFLQPMLPGFAKVLSDVFHVTIAGGEPKMPMPRTAEMNADEQSPFARRFLDTFRGEGPATPRGTRATVDAHQFQPKLGGEVPDGGPEPKDGPPPTSTLTATASDKFLIIRLNVDWDPVYYTYISPSLRSSMDLMKGEALMMTGRAHWQTLAVGIDAMRKKPDATVPPAAYPRPNNPARFNLPYPPDTRVSWMVDLLPSLGYDGVARAVKRDEAWNSNENLVAGAAWIPEFLSRESPPSSWRARVPSLKGRELGATHFVGLSGIGADAASLPDTPEYKDKLGMFGYDRQAKFADVSDGLENTMFIIQVPPTLQRAWIRGGGSTVQGVPTTSSVKPFVSATWNGKKGTHVLMADGSIRFVTEGISDPVFQALTTYKAGDKVGKIDEIAPLMKGEAKLVGGRND